MCRTLDQILDIADGRGLPNPTPNGEVPCCAGSAMFGYQACTCWEPLFDPNQPAQADAVLDAPRETRAAMCSDCAFRPGSPERRDSDAASAGSDDLLRIVAGGGEFACHDGMRVAIGWRHPNGMTHLLEGDNDGVVAYHPPRTDGWPIRLDGTPALACAGLAAARRAKDWTP